MSDLMLDVGQANELKLAFRKHGYTNHDVKRLTEEGVLADMLEVLKGFSSIATVEGPTIDCDRPPRLPEMFKEVEEHRPGGLVVFKPKWFHMHFPERKRNLHMRGTTIRKELQGWRGVLNACMMDFLLANPHLIPHEWVNPRDEHGWHRRTTIFFWGTIFRAQDDSLWVPGLELEKGLIQATYYPLSGWFHPDSNKILLRPLTREEREENRLAKK